MHNLIAHKFIKCPYCKRETTARNGYLQLCESCDEIFYAFVDQDKRMLILRAIDEDDFKENGS